MADLQPYSVAALSAVSQALRRGTVSPGETVIVKTHDRACGSLRGDPCDCRPQVERVVVPAQEEN